MARRTLVERGITYTVADDDPARRELLPWAVLRTRVVDELTLLPPVARLTLTSDLAGARPRVADGGVCGLVARPRDVAYALTTADAFTARVEAPGYLPRDLTPAIDAARRTLTAITPAGTNPIAIAPPDPAPRLQFTPGRGVLVARPAPIEAELFTTVADTGVAPAPAAVDLANDVDTARPAGAAVAGVPLVLPVQPLHRDGVVRLRGLVRRRIGPNTVVAGTGASVGILGIWWDYPSSTTAGPLAPDVCAIAPTVRAAHAVGDPVATCTLTAGGPPRRLVTGAAAGSRVVQVTPNGGLLPGGGDLLRIGDPLTTEHEVVVSDGFDAPFDPLSPVRVRLRTPTAYLHRGDSPVREVAAATAALSAIAREAVVGDAVIFAAGVTGLATSSVIAVAPGTPRAAFYRATQLPFTPDGVAFSHQVPLDGDGRFEWPPVARVAQLRLVVSHPAHGPLQRDVALDYSGDTTVAVVLT